MKDFDRAVRNEACSMIGAEIADSVWDRAYESAKNKLRHIVTRYGDADGERNTVAYIAQLVTEAIRADALTQYLAERYERGKNEGAGTKADPQGHINIIPQTAQKSQAVSA